MRTRLFCFRLMLIDRAKPTPSARRGRVVRHSADEPCLRATAGPFATVAPVRLRLAVVLTTVLVAAPTAALAAKVNGTSGADRLLRTPQADTIGGRAGHDAI